MGMKSLFAAAAFAVAVVASAAPASALPFLSGTIGISGAENANGTDLTNTNTFTFTAAFMTVGTGDLVGTPGTAVSMPTPLVFDPFVGPVTGFFTVAITGGTLTFDLNTASVNGTPTATHLDMSGTGTLHLTGYADTPAIWNFSATNTSGTFTFDSPVGTAVPEPASIALLGAGLAGLGLRRKKRSA